MQVRLSAAVVIIMASCLVPGARADSPKPDDVVKPIFGDTRGDKSYACFVRHYGASHLARHRKQSVTEIRLLLTAEKIAEDEQLNYSFAFNASVRNRGRWEAGGGCGHAELSETRAGAVDLGCTVDCEGGLISVELVAAGKPAVVRLRNLRVSRIGRPEDSRQAGGRPAPQPARLADRPAGEQPAARRRRRRRVPPAPRQSQRVQLADAQGRRARQRRRQVVASDRTVNRDPPS